MATTKKPTTKKAADKPKAPRKPRAVKKETPEAVATEALEHAKVTADTTEAPSAELSLKEGKYSYAVGRRKTSVANVRLFSGKAKSIVNKKDLPVYFANNKLFLERVFKPLQLTGLENRVYIYANVSGGGLHSQAQAVAHGISLALVKHTPEYRKVLKKNGALTRDSRMKERKKPGLKRARRGPQWAKR